MTRIRVTRQPDNAIVRLLDDVRQGDPEALGTLLPMVYDELRRLASGYLHRERRGHTLQATALVHEAYLRLADKTEPRWQNRAHLIGITAHVMRQILVDYARAHGAAKRAGAQRRLTLDEAIAVTESPPVDVIALDRALDRLAARDRDQCQIVELRYFAGLTVDETAAAMGISPATVKREWALAKAWLLRELEKGSEHGH